MEKIENLHKYIFGDTEIDNKIPILINNIDINKTVVSNKVSFV